MHLKEHFVGFNLMYWTPIYGKCVLEGRFLEKCGQIWKKGRFSGGLQPDLGKHKVKQ